MHTDTCIGRDNGFIVCISKPDILHNRSQNPIAVTGTCYNRLPNTAIIDSNPNQDTGVAVSVLYPIREEALHWADPMSRYLEWIYNFVKLILRLKKPQGKLSMQKVKEMSLIKIFIITVSVKYYPTLLLEMIHLYVALNGSHHLGHMEDWHQYFKPYEEWRTEWE
jgi:hypothetical protein